MRKLFALLAALTLGLLWVGTVSGANGDNLRFINADTNGTQCGDADPAFGIGVGLAFDGTNLLLSCYNDSKVTAVSPADGSQVAIHTIIGASSLGALAWDNTRGLLWGCSNFNVVGTIDLSTNIFTPRFGVHGCFDGLAYDGSDDTIWTSPDAQNDVGHFTTAGVTLAHYFPALPCGNSGIAVGGPLLYLATNGCSSIYTSVKDFSSAPVFFASFPARLEDMECDNVTFAPKGAIWSKDAYDNNLNAWEIPANSCLFGGGRSDLTLDPPDGDNPTGTTHTVTAHLSDRDGPVSGAHILFSVTGANTASGDGTTDASGDASFSYLGVNPGDDTITACYDKDNDNFCDPDEVTATAHKHWRVVNADISVRKTGPAYAQSGGTITYVITVHNGGPANATGVVMNDPLPAGETLVSATPSQGSCSGSVTCNLGSIANGASATVTIVATVTAASGSTVCNTATAKADQPDPITDNNSSTTCAFIYAGSAGGMFVIGDLNAAVGTSVTFWGAQWWKLNSLSGGAAPAAFKGFEDTPPAPGCGTNWTTDPGNSTPPPAGPLPAYMAVIVSSSITKSGSTISGNTPHIVIVKTNPGYQPNPGHAGTGTVFAQVC
jgi:uncharacterized repeat protein (TIGR01451 family)